MSKSQKPNVMKKLFIALCVAVLPFIMYATESEIQSNTNSKFVVLSPNSDLTKIEVYSSTGELVYSSDKSLDSAVLDVENWNKGRYTAILHHNQNFELMYFTVF